MPLDFSKKLGPLPVYVWGGIIGVGVVGVMWYEQQRHASAAATPATPVDTTGMADGALSSLGTDTGNVGINDGSPTTDASSPTNADWETKALQYLMMHGFSPIKAQRALEDYLNGIRLGPEQADMVNRALRQYGEPPEGTYGIPSVSASHDKPTPKPPPKAKSKQPTKHPAPKPKPKPHPVLRKKDPIHHDPGPTHPRHVPVHHTTAPKPTMHHATQPAYHLYTIKSGDTLWELARRFYGSGTRANEEKIAHANGIHNLNLIYAGHTIKIPKD